MTKLKLNYNSSEYKNIHRWVKLHYGGASTKKCSIDPLHKGKIDWANIDRIYERDIKHFVTLCSKCHKTMDVHKISFEELKRRQDIRERLLFRFAVEDGTTP